MLRHNQKTRAVNKKSIECRFFFPISLCLYHFILSTIPQSIFNESLVGCSFFFLFLFGFFLSSFYLLDFVFKICNGYRKQTSKIHRIKYKLILIIAVILLYIFFSLSQCNVPCWSLSALWFLVYLPSLAWKKNQQKNTQYRPPSTISNIQ